MHNKRSHLFHIINPAPWPFFTTITLFNVLAGVILWVNKYLIGINIIIISFIILFLFVHFWFTDIVREASFEGKHSIKVMKGLRLGMMLFIISEIMFFFGFFWAYFHFSLSPSIEIGCLWPPYGIQVFNYLQIPLYNTMVLLLSGVCVTWCHYSVFKNHHLRKKTRRVTDQFPELTIEQNVIALVLTILLAIHFTYYQVIEYTEASFTIADSVYGSIFFMATGFHGFHVIIGTWFLIICFYRLLKGHFAYKRNWGFEFAIWYWHFVDVVWLFLYVCVYWWGSV